jgi:hypothetical protein
MFATGPMMLIAKLPQTPISTSFPLAQLILGSIGLYSIVSYVLIRQGIAKGHKCEQVSNLRIYLWSIREWLGGHHATGHARAGNK